jgi:ATP-dependent Clp protease adaptor protein ClpS
MARFMASHEFETETETEVDRTTSLAPRWRVIIHNDDVTPMDFVVNVLMQIFRLGLGEADNVMLEAHHTGVAHVITLPLEEAEVRVERAHSLARTKRYPLTFTYEPDK